MRDFERLTTTDLGSTPAASKLRRGNSFNDILRKESIENRFSDKIGFPGLKIDLWMKKLIKLVDGFIDEIDTINPPEKLPKS